MAFGSEVTPKPAATVVLVRDGKVGREVFLTKRPDTMDFLGGFYVFPGGRVDKSDKSEKARERVIGFDQNDFKLWQKYELEWQRDGEPSNSADLVYPIDFCTAAIRELFEESGVLLMCDEEQKIVSNNIYEEMRRSVNLNPDDFLKGVIEKGLYYAAFKLKFVQLFVTPQGSRKRFYTIFFSATLPKGQRAGIETDEVSESFWVSPEAALKKGESGEFPMIFPTILALKSILES
jgi:8-oxo-dGTP pyrophosphatase MutT (NUDIX family)